MAVRDEMNVISNLV